MGDIECAGFIFTADFDSGNLARVELVSKDQNVIPPSPSVAGKSSPVELPDFEFNIWTKPDCSGTEFENANRTWFYFGIRGGAPFSLLKLNIVNLNKQSKMYSQGMAPVYRVVPGRSHWDRIKDKPTYTVVDNDFTLSFKHRTLENLRATTYFAFTYPYPYKDLQLMLSNVDTRFTGSSTVSHLDDIYYHRECVCYSPGRLRVDLLTISSYHGIGLEREPRLQNLFPEGDVMRPFIFPSKKVVFISARVHPGETPSSFVLNGLLNLLLNRDDPTAVLLRKLFVFKLIPMLNPDGVARGHYRTDTRGVNLNRVYLCPSPSVHPSVYAARALLRYHHHGREVDDDDAAPAVGGDVCDGGGGTSSTESASNRSARSDELEQEVDVGKVVNIESQVSGLTLNDTTSSPRGSDVFSEIHDVVLRSVTKTCELVSHECDDNVSMASETLLETDSTSEPSGECLSNQDPDPIPDDAGPKSPDPVRCSVKSSETIKATVGGGKQLKIVSAVGCGSVVTEDSGLFLYVDLHGHASKKGIFMYGNHFEDGKDSIECMLLPRIMALNSQNFHFTSCNFTERNMYLKDRRDGMSREGSGRVAVLKATGLVRSYTLECNYNTGRLVNVLPTCVRDPGKQSLALLVPPKYTPQVFEEIGRALGTSILDLVGSNPWSRIPNSEFRTLSGIRDWLRQNCIPEQMHLQRQKRVQRQANKPQVMGTSSGSTCRGRVDGTRSRRLAPLGLEPRVNNASPLPLISDKKENLAVELGSKSPTALKPAKGCTESDENAGPSFVHKGAIKKLKGSSGPSGSVLKEVLAVRTKCSVIGALASSSKCKTSPKLIQPQRTVGASGGGGLKKSNQVIVTAGSRLAKFRKSSNFAKSRDLNLALCAFPSATKVNQMFCDRKLGGWPGNRKGIGEQAALKGSKRMRVMPVKQDQASCSGMLGCDTLSSPEREAVGGIFLKTVKTFKEYSAKSKTDDVELNLEHFSEDNQANPWNLICEPNMLTCSTSQKSSLMPKSNFVLRKVVGQTNVIKPRAPASRSSKPDLQSAGSSAKYCTKLDKQTKPRVPHLNPVKGLHKSPSFSKKKSSDLVKKRGKVTLRNVATSISKLRATTSDQTQTMVQDKKRKKATSKFL